MKTNNTKAIENIMRKVREMRKEKGYSHEVMALELGINPSTYNKIERMEIKITLERFIQIKDILETDFAVLFDIKTENFQQNNHEHGTGFLQKEYNNYADNKEVYQELIKSKDDQIALLQETMKQKDRLIDFLQTIGNK